MANICENAIELFHHAVDMVKFSLLVVSCQFGKTYLTVKQIQKHIDEDKDFVTGDDGNFIIDDGKLATKGQSLHIIFTMNTLLNNMQFSVRVKNIEDKYGVGSVCVVASKYSGEYKCVKTEASLYRALKKDTKIRVIIMCTNLKRTTDGVSIIQKLNNDLVESQSSTIKRVFVYYDELHYYINSNKLRSGIEIIHDLPIVKEIIGITATPLNIWTDETGRWARLNVYHLDDFNTDNYVGFNDLEYEYQDEYFLDDDDQPKTDLKGQKEYLLGYIDHCLEKCDTILDKGNRVFIPAQVALATHFAVRDHIHKVNREVVVIMINGVEKNITFYANERTNRVTTIDIVPAKGEELCDTISRILIREDLLTRAIVYTGFLCISMGQTLVNSTIGSFTHSILCHVGLSNCELYQLAGRLNGRMMNWDTYARTLVFCPTSIKKILIDMEKCAFGMAALAQSHEKMNASRDDYIENMSDDTQETNRKPKKPKHVKDTSNMRVPVVLENIDPSHPIFSMKRTLGMPEKVEIVSSLVEEFGESYGHLLEFIQNPDVVCGKISRTMVEKSYKKHITNVINAAASEKPYIVDIYKNQKKNNCWNLFIDDREHRVCFVMWVLDESYYRI